MKIRRLVISDIDYKPLMKGIDLFFPKSNDEYIHANCFIGVNGSGKSQILELIAEIFLFLDRIFRVQNTKDGELSPFSFLIEYEIVLNNVEHLIIIDCQDIKTKKKDIIIEVFKSNSTDGTDFEEIEFNLEEFNFFLPNKVVGYTSGDNETLSLPFDSYYDEYASYTADRASGAISGEDYEPRLYFMNYNTNLGIAISSLIFEDQNPKISLLKAELNISKLISFKLLIQTKQQKAPLRNKGGIILTEQLEIWKNKLIQCASRVENNEDFKSYVLTFDLDQITIEAFKHHFSDALELYTALYKLELLNNLIIPKKIREKVERERKNRKLVTKMPMVAEDDKVLSYSELKLELSNGNIVDYLSLSDGEHQYLNVFGTVLMINQKNSLFLLDEPETHFNPKWRRTFVSTLKKITKNRVQDMFITSHSPFVVSDTKRENVFVFTRENGKVIISEPKDETYGASFDEILKMAFEINIPISADSLSLIEKLEKETNYQTIEEKIEELGESYQLSSLYRRIEFLKSNKKE